MPAYCYPSDSRAQLHSSAHLPGPQGTFQISNLIIFSGDHGLEIIAVECHTIYLPLKESDLLAA